eukprot:3215363-Lingulodinium_polyedra.AAC.1
MKTCAGVQAADVNWQQQIMLGREVEYDGRGIGKNGMQDGIAGSFRACGSVWQQVQAAPHIGLPGKHGRWEATRLFSFQTQL